MSDLKEILEAKQALNAKIKKSGKKIVDEFLAEFFAENPKINAISWYQYVPGFNDGDPCTFSVGEVAFRISGEPLTEDAADDLDDRPADTSAEGEPEWVTLYDDKAPSVVKKMTKLINTAEDILESVFGSNARVVATKDFTKRYEYECGY